MRIFSVIVAELLLGAAAPAPVAPADTAAAKAFIVKIYEPYRSQDSDINPEQAPIYSAATTTLLRQWQKATAHLEITDLTEAGWLCQCQDWDAKAFRITSQTITPAGAGKLQSNIAFTQGWGSTAKARFLLVKEAGRWRVDDLFSADMPNGLKVAMRQSIIDAKRVP